MSHKKRAISQPVNSPQASPSAASTSATLEPPATHLVSDTAHAAHTADTTQQLTSTSSRMGPHHDQMINLTVEDLLSHQVTTQHQPPQPPQPPQKPSSQPPISQAINSHPGPAPQLPRLDQYCTQMLGDEYSRSQLQRAIREGKILVDGKVETRPGARLKPGQQLSIPMFNLSDLAGADRDHLTPWDYPLEIHYEDDELLVINKPHGIAVHPGAGQPNQTILNALVGYLNLEGHLQRPTPQVHHSTLPATQPPLATAPTNNRPGIVHRLDRDTTGLMVLAKTPFAERALQEQFAARSVGRCYLALALSSPRRTRGIDQADSGTIDQPLGRHPNDRKLFTVIEDGRRAVTHWRVAERMEFAALVELRLETGRTHQIRVHLDFISSPVIGDKTYGNFSSLPKTLLDKSLRFGRQALHAQTLEFNHPRTGQRLSFSVEPPKDMLQLIDDFRGGRLL